MPRVVKVWIHNSISPEGTAEMPRMQSRVLLPLLDDWRQPRTMSWATSAVPTGLLGGYTLTQDSVLGYSQPSLRDSIWRGWFSCRL